MLKALWPADRKAFRDKYLAAAMICLAFLFCNSASAQVDTTKSRQFINGVGFNWKNGSFDSSLRIPRDTFKLKVADSGSMAYKGTNLYKWDGYLWSLIQGGGGGSFTADETTLHLNGSNQFSIKSSYPGQTSIVDLGIVAVGTWQSTPIADPYIASSATWNAKLGATLGSAQLFVGNGSNVATAVSMSGDATMTNAGVVSLVNTGTGAGSCTNCNITFDAKGREVAYTNGTGGGSGAPFNDNTALVQNNADNTRKLILNAGTIATGTTRTLTAPNVNGTIATIDNAQTFAPVQTLTLAPILTALNGYVKANTSSAATASTTIPNTDITGLGTASTKNVAASGNAASTEVVKGDDSRLTDSRAPTGSAGGSFMNGTYPNPGIVANSIGNSQASQMGANTIKGNSTGSTANAADLTISQVATMLGSSFQAPGNYVANTTGAGFLGGSVLASRPTSPSGTGFWYETDNKVLDYWNGSSWVQATQTPGSYVTNLGGSSGINRGAYLSRASASSASNTFYWSTDSVFWSYSDGSSWKDLKSGSGGGGSGNSINARGDTVTNGSTQFYTDPNPGNGGWYQMKLMKNTEAALGTLRDTTSTVQYKPGGLGNSMMEHADREIAFVNYMHPKFRSAGVGFLSMGNNRPFVPVQVPGSSWTGRNVFTTPAGRGLDGYDAISNGGADSIVVSVGTQNKGFDFTWGTTVEVFWIGQSGGGTFKIDIDGKGGGSYVTVNTASATGAQRTVISGLTDGPHVVAITSVSEGTNHNIITGLNEYRSVGGWIYEHFAKGSGYTTHFVALNAVEWETQLSWVHPTSIDIDLAVTSVDVVDSAGYRTGVDTIIHRIRAVDSLIDICLYQSTPFSASLGVTQFNRLPSVDRNIKRLAYDDACALWDPSAIYGKTIFSSVYRGTQFNDSIHRTPVGYTAELGLQMGAYGALSNYIPPIRPNFYDNDGDIWTTKVVNLHNNGVRWDSVGTWKIDGKTGNGTMIWDFTNPLQISVNTGGLKVQSDYNWSTSGILNITGTSAANNLSAALTVGGSSLSSSRTLQINNTSYALVAAASASNTAAAGFENRVGTGLTLDGQFYSVKNSISAVQDSNSTSVLGLLGDVNVGAANVHGKLKFFVGGTSAGNEVARFTVNRNFLLNTPTDVPSSILTVSSTTQGILPPAMTTTQMNAIASPANGLLVYNTTAAAFYYWNGSAWGAVGSGGGGSNYQTVQNAGSGLTQRPTLNFPSAGGLTAVDNSGNTSSDVSITSIPSATTATTQAGHDSSTKLTTTQYIDKLIGTGVYLPAISSSLTSAFSVDSAKWTRVNGLITIRITGNVTFTSTGTNSDLQWSLPAQAGGANPTYVGSFTLSGFNTVLGTSAVVSIATGPPNVFDVLIDPNFSGSTQHYVLFAIYNAW